MVCPNNPFCLQRDASRTLMYRVALRKISPAYCLSSLEFYGFGDARYVSVSMSAHRAVRARYPRARLTLRGDLLHGSSVQRF
jgi:hypothetical protein